MIGQGKVQCDLKKGTFTLCYVFIKVSAMILFICYVNKK